MRVSSLSFGSTGSGVGVEETDDEDREDDEEAEEAEEAEEEEEETAELEAAEREGRESGGRFAPVTVEESICWPPNQAGSFASCCSSAVLRQ